MTKIEEEDTKRLDTEITEEEVSSTLKNTKNNVAPGPGGFGGGAFYKMFWKYFKQIVVGAIREVYENIIYMSYWPQIFLKLMLKPLQEKSYQLKDIFNCDFFGYPLIFEEQVIWAPPPCGE